MECNVVYAADDCYASLAGISMMSLFENNQDIDELNVFILSNGITEKNVVNLYTIGKKYHRNVCILDVMCEMQKWCEFRTMSYKNALGDGFTALIRLFISEILPDLERVIYLDCDTLVLKNLETLFLLDMKSKPIAMAFDCLHNLYKKYINIPREQNYYNSGVMVIDLKKWKEDECLERLVFHMRNIRNRYPLADQDIINVVLHDDVTLIDMKYNYLSQYYLYDYDGAKTVYRLKETYFWKRYQWIDPDEAAILHFCGNTFVRPWFCNSKHPAKKIYDIYYMASPFFEGGGEMQNGMAI